MNFEIRQPGATEEMENKKIWTCRKCKEFFTLFVNYSRHRKTKNCCRKEQCPQCLEIIRFGHINRHVQRHHEHSRGKSITKSITKHEISLPEEELLNIHLTPEKESPKFQFDDWERLFSKWSSLYLLSLEKGIEENSEFLELWKTSFTEREIEKIQLLLSKHPLIRLKNCVGVGVNNVYMLDEDLGGLWKKYKLDF